MSYNSIVMNIMKLSKIFLIVIYAIIISFLMINNNYIISNYNLPKILIPFIFYLSIIILFLNYINRKIRYSDEEEMFSIINHTFRTPLTSIIWHSKELEKNLPQNEKFIYLQNLNNSANKLLDIVDILAGIKDFNNLSNYYFEAISIREIIEKSIKKYRDKINKKNINFQVSTFSDIPLITIDIKKISFVVDSLIENSVLYTQQNGRVVIDSIYNDNKITIYVNDTGIGLNLKDKLMLFSKFYRSQKAKSMNVDGTGLKLYLSKKIIKKHNGKIYAKSNGKNEGSTFFIKLPIKTY